MIDNILDSGYSFSDKQQPLRFRVRGLNIMLLLCIVAGSYYMLLFYSQETYREFYVIQRNFLFVMLSLGYLIVLRHSVKYYNMILMMMVFTLLIFFIHVLYVQADNSSRHLWFVLPIVVSYYFGNRNLGIGTTVISVAVLVIYSQQSFMPSSIATFSLHDGISILLLLSIVIAIFQKEYQRVVSSLKVNELKLKKSNTLLDSQMKHELAENEEKTALMIKESRFAQMGKILSMIAHHWRQPLSSISTASANMKMSIMLNERNDEKFLNNIESIDHHVVLLSKTINDFRGFFQSSKEKQVTTMQKIMKDAFDIVQETMTSNGIRFELDMSNSVSIKVYKQELVQAVLNILTNANEVFIERKLENAMMSIRTFYNDEDVMVEIEDNAGGVDIQPLSNIFEPYFSTKKERNGTGLGLYVSKTIIEKQLHGSLVASQTEKGLSFMITIPRYLGETV